MIKYVANFELSGQLDGYILLILIVCYNVYYMVRIVRDLMKRIK